MFTNEVSLQVKWVQTETRPILSLLNKTSAQFFLNMRRELGKNMAG